MVRFGKTSLFCHVAEIQEISRCTGFFCHFRLITQNQIVTDLQFQEFEKNEPSILLDQAQFIATEDIATGEILGEFNLPVLTQIDNENSENFQNLVVDSLDGVQGLNHQSAFDQYAYGQNVHLLTKFDQKVGQDWSETSLLSDAQLQEDDVTLAHVDPTLVTVQVTLI